ncbi:uncharacterized protein [Scyliorhinus torazame]|uniref:uncharacterized protein isoform X1 n=1 Tax=Scyliorhinus torazame TaxID=75743 RepID=UPI003B5BCD45
MSSEEQYNSVQDGDGVLTRFQKFARTRKGLVLLAEMVLSLVVFICFCASVQGGYSAAPIIELIFSIIFFVIFMNQFDQSLPFIHWPWTDFIRCGIAVIVFIIISIIAVISGEGARITGGNPENDPDSRKSLGSGRHPTVRPLGGSFLHLLNRTRWCPRSVYINVPNRGFRFNRSCGLRLRCLSYLPQSEAEAARTSGHGSPRLFSLISGFETLR